VPGYNRAEVNAQLKVVTSPRGEQSPRAQIEAGMQAASASGLASHESGPDTMALSGGRSEVLDAVQKVIAASLEAGAHAVQVEVEAQGESEKFGRAGGRRGRP
jgi:hypothetical protein